MTADDMRTGVAGPGPVRLGALPPLPRDVNVSVIIPARGAATLLEDCLAAVLPQLHDGDELIIAAGDDATAFAARSSSDVRVHVVVNTAGTTPAALNVAIAMARHPIIIRVDAQSRLPADYRDRVVALLAGTGASTVGGRQVARGARGMSVAIAAAMNARLGHGGASYRSGARGGPVDTVYLGAFRADVLHALGGFDEHFTTNQDAELNERIRRAGGTVWLDPTLEVTYLPRTGLRALARQFLGYGRGRAMTARRHPGSLARRQLAAPTLVLGLLAALAVAPWTIVPLGLWTAGYGSLLILGTLLEGGDARRWLPVTVAALVVMHLAWGAGFLAAPRPPRRT